MLACLITSAEIMYTIRATDITVIVGVCPTCMCEQVQYCTQCMFELPVMTMWLIRSCETIHSVCHNTIMTSWAVSILLSHIHPQYCYYSRGILLLWSTVLKLGSWLGYTECSQYECNDIDLTTAHAVIINITSSQQL